MSQRVNVLALQSAAFAAEKAAQDAAYSAHLESLQAKLRDRDAALDKLAAKVKEVRARERAAAEAARKREAALLAALEAANKVCCGAR